MSLLKRASQYKLHRYTFTSSTIRIYDLSFYSWILDLMFEIDNMQEFKHEGT